MQTCRRHATRSPTEESSFCAAEQASIVSTLSLLYLRLLCGAMLAQVCYADNSPSTNLHSGSLIEVKMSTRGLLPSVPCRRSHFTGESGPLDSSSLAVEILIPTEGRSDCFPTATQVCRVKAPLNSFVVSEVHLDRGDRWPYPQT